MHFVYILKSQTSGKNYIGCTDNLLRRFHEHLWNQEKSTRNRGPWEMIHWEPFQDRIAALRRERYLKTGAGFEWRKLNGIS